MRRLLFAHSGSPRLPRAASWTPSRCVCAFRLGKDGAALLRLLRSGTGGPASVCRSRQEAAADRSGCWFRSRAEVSSCLGRRLLDWLCGSVGLAGARSGIKSASTTEFLFRPKSGDLGLRRRGARSLRDSVSGGAEPGLSAGSPGIPQDFSVDDDRPVHERMNQADVVERAWLRELERRG
jgi:hypothetical protein